MNIIDPEEGSSPRRPRRPRRRRRIALAVVGAVILGLIALRVAAPWIIAGQIEGRLRAAFGGAVAIDDVDIRLFAGKLRIEGITLLPDDPTSASALRVRSVELDWGVQEIFGGGSPPLDVRVVGLDLTLDLHAPWPIAAAEGAAEGAEDGSPAAAEEAAKGSAIGRLGLRSLTVTDGHIELVPTRDVAPVLVLSELQGSVSADDWETRGESMTTRFELEAASGGDGRVTISGGLSPTRPRDFWTAHAVVDRLDLRPLNPIFREVIEMTVEGGTLSLVGDLTAGDGRLRGSLIPSFDDLEILAPGEAVRHPMAEAIFSSMLASADLPIEIDRPLGGGARGRALTLDDAFRTDALELLEGMILSGFTRRLDSLVGHDATVGGVEVDFPHGVLAFTDVTLRKTDGTAEEPFLQVARLEVIVESSVVDPSIDTYKAVIFHQPRVLLIDDGTEAGTQRTIDPEWQSKISALPYPTDQMTIIGGEVEYRDATTSPPSRFVLGGIDLTADGLARGRGHGPGSRDAEVSLRALVMGESPLALTLAFTPGSPTLDGALGLVLEPLALVRLNGLLRSRFGIDVSTGTLGLVAAFDVRDGHLHGEVTPTVRDVSILGADEVDMRHPLRELLLERRLQRLDGVLLRLDVDGDRDLLQRLPGALLDAIRDAK